MKRKQIDHIPLDLLVEILIRLPAKSVFKFKTVSNIWLSVIVSRLFIDSFVSISSTRSRFLVAFNNGIFAKRGERRLFFFSSSQEGPESAKHYMTVPNLGVSTLIGSFASVHGFMGCQLSPGYIICNPSTRQVIVLPTLPISPERHPCPDIRGTCLGYDPVSDQFKALSLISSRLRNHDHVEHLVLTLKGDKRKYSWRQIQGKYSIPPYSPVTMKVCIRGKVYYGAWTPKLGMEPVIVCFDVRSEKLTFIKAPSRDVLCWQSDSLLLEYKGKLASVVRYPFDIFDSFDLWILEDVEKHEWSKQTFAFPLSWWDSVWALKMSFPGTNKAGELILAPRYLQLQLGPYNVETNNIRRVRLQGIADDEEFRHSYGFGKTIRGFDDVYITPEHVENLRVL